MRIPIDAIAIGPSHRKIMRGAVKELAVSIQTIGLKMPITVRPDPRNPGRFILVAGRHRIEACRKLGWVEIEAETQGETDNKRRDRRAAKLWEIAENLHRAELTAIQRSLGIGEWVKLKAEQIEEEQKERKLRQVGVAKPLSGQKKGGVRAAARELGIPETTARRAVYIANNLNQAAQKEAEKLGLDDNQKALERAAKVSGNEDQIASLRRTAARREAEQAEAIASASPKLTPEQAFSLWFRSLDIVLRTEVVIWLLGLDMENFVEELRQAEETMRRDREAMH